MITNESDHQVGVLRQLSSGRGQSGHQAGDRLGSVSRQSGTQGRRHLPGLPHGQGPWKARGLRDGALRRRRRQGDQPRTQARQSPLHRSGLFDRPSRHLPSQPEGPGHQSSRTGCSSTGAPAGAPPKFEDKVARWQDQDRVSQALGRCARPRRGAPDHRREPREARQSATRSRKQVMENCSKVDGPYIEGSPTVGADLAFSYKIKNTNTGHNLPSGSLGAQPQLWVNVALVDPDGNNIWESGLRRQQRRHGRSAQPGCRGWPHLRRPAAGAFPDQVPDDQRQGHGPRDVPAGELRHRSAAASASAGDPDHRSQPSAAGAYGEPLAGAAGGEAGQVSSAGQPDHRSRASTSSPSECAAAPSRSTSCASSAPPRKWSGA